jgi:YVTN family beta-propeller protein
MNVIVLFVKVGQVSVIVGTIGSLATPPVAPLPEVPPDQRHLEGLQGSPSHGMGIAPDGKTLWVNSKINSHVYAYSMPDVKYLGGVRVGKVPDWLTFSPDSKKLYVANAHSNFVSVIDVAARKEVAQIKVGQVPKRNITAVLVRPGT